MKKTRIINENNIDNNFENAGNIIRSGGLVVFPTETVYGIGADALNSEAVADIFKAKGRPSDNPLIVHISSEEQLDELSDDVNDTAKKLMKKFWPGPLTILLNKKDTVPDRTTGGLKTVAVRMPANQIALKLIDCSQRSIAAPSANISGKPSPTEVEHVVSDLFGKVDMIIDGGSTDVGIESTVIDVTCSPPVILRPGAITKEDIESVIGETVYDKALNKDVSAVPRSPGQKYRHYCPNADLRVFIGDEKAVIEKIRLEEERYIEKGCNSAVITVDEHKNLFKSKKIISLGSKKDYKEVARNLFKSLRECDHANVDIILAEGFEEEGIGKAIMNRLEKASGRNIEYL